MESQDDNPFLRHQATTLDLSADGKPISRLRLVALNHARKMPVSDDGTSIPQTAEYIYSQPASPGASNWIQLGPTAVPGGQTLSTYYPPFENIPALVTGRVTSIVVDPTDSNIIYVGTAQGGVWKTIDGGRNWFATSDYAPSLSIGALVIDPQDPQVLYAGTGEGNITREKVIIGRKHPESYYGCGILKTTDGGNKWMLLEEKVIRLLVLAFFA